MVISISPDYADFIFWAMLLIMMYYNNKTI